MVGPVQYEYAVAVVVIVFVVVDGTVPATYIVCRIHTSIAYFKASFKTFIPSLRGGSKTNGDIATLNLGVKYLYTCIC